MSQAIAPMSVLEAIDQRRSVRSYLPHKLDWPTINSLLAAAVRAPTAVHEEPWAFVIVQDPAMLRRISDRARLAFADEPHADLLARGGHALDIFADPQFNIFHNAGTLIIIGTQMTGSFVAADCWLAAENLMLAACATGLASCVIGSAVAALNLGEIKDELGVPSDFVAVAPIVVGMAQGDTTPTFRKAPHVLAWT